MATQTAIGSGSTQNNGGTIFGAGNFKSGNITNDHSLIENSTDDNAYGSKVVKAVSPASSGNIGTIQPLSGGTFAYNAPSNRWVMFGGNVTQNISGASNTVLAAGASDKNRGNHNPATLNTSRRLDETYWLLPSGVVQKGSNAGASYNYANGAGGNASDTAGGTASVPGEFTYMVTGKTPTQADYSPRTG